MPKALFPRQHVALTTTLSPVPPSTDSFASDPDKQKITINGIEFTPLPGVGYLNPYWNLKFVQNDKRKELGFYRMLAFHDPFFFVYFILGWKKTNHPWIIARCNELARGPKSDTVDAWPREHGKSTIITIAGSIMRVADSYANHKIDERICIFSWSKEAARKFVRSIRNILEENTFLQDVFYEVFYKYPQREARYWSDDIGLWIRRINATHKEGTFEAYGLNENLPTGSHFTGRMYDDVETEALIRSPDVTATVKENYDLSQYVGSEDDWERVVGTFYMHDGPMQYIINKKDEEGNPLYTTRIHPGTEYGAADGKLVFLSEKRAKKFRSNPYTFYTQIILNPTPPGRRKLDSSKLVVVDSNRIPKNLWRFMVVEPAGSRKDRRGDNWAIFLLGVHPFRDDQGFSDLYILDLVIEEMPINIAHEKIIKMYVNGGQVLTIAVERAAASTHELHIANALAAQNLHISQDDETLTIVSPKGRPKNFRIESNLQAPLLNGKIKISSSVQTAYRQTLIGEMDTFPFGAHDDGIDGLAYGYDVIEQYRFPAYDPSEDNDTEDDVEVKEDSYDEEEEDLNKHYKTFMGV